MLGLRFHCEPYSPVPDLTWGVSTLDLPPGLLGRLLFRRARPPKAFFTRARKQLTALAPLSAPREHPGRSPRRPRLTDPGRHPRPRPRKLPQESVLVRGPRRTHRSVAWTMFAIWIGSLCVGEGEQEQERERESEPRSGRQPAISAICLSPSSVDRYRFPWPCWTATGVLDGHWTCWTCP